MLAGFEEAFKGRALPPLPDELIGALGEAGQSSTLLLLRRGDAGAVTQALAVVNDSKASREERLLHIRALGEVHPAAAMPALLTLVKQDGELDFRKAALAALSGYDDVAIGREITAAYANLSAALQTAAQSLLTSRATWSAEFLKLIQNGAVKTADVSSEAIARLRQHSEKSVVELTTKLFPKPQQTLRPDMRAAMAKIQRTLSASPGNPYAGEPIFLQRCGSCHQLFHKGGHVGPDLTPYQRDDLGTMLPSILDPSAEIREGYVNYLVQTNDGRALGGFLSDQDANVIMLRGFDGQDISLARADVREMKPAGTSLMPEGLLDGLDEQQLRDLFAYLRIPQPISK